MRCVEGKLCSLLRRLCAVGVKWYKQRFWNNLKPGRRSASGHQWVLVCGTPTPSRHGTGVSLLQSYSCPRRPSPTHSLERRLFPAYICWHQLSALGIECAGRAMEKRARGPRWGQGEDWGNRAGSHFVVTRQSLSQPICSQK